MDNLFEELNARDFIKGLTDEEGIQKILSHEKITGYIGFDPTADSLHVGSLMPLMALSHFQRYGHRPIAIIGGATAMIGDPSGKDTMRSMMTEETILGNMDSIKKQMEKFVDFNDGKALILNNADWLKDYKYIEFLRDIGIHFSVNVMVKAKCFSQRLEREEGLSFLEFNYMLLQGYDFYYLKDKYNCKLQMGGDDQWSNILAGIELTRRKSGKQVYGLTLPLLVTASGAKMGKTEKGAVWLDENKTPVNEFYQYWRNTDDRDVERFLKYFTFIDLGTIKKLSAEKEQELNKVKSILAYEVTKLIHGEKKAMEALYFEKDNFEMSDYEWNFIRNECSISDEIDIQSMANTFIIKKEDIEQKLKLTEFMVDNSIISSLSEGKRLIKQKGIKINNNTVEDINLIIEEGLFIDSMIELNKGKKKKYKLLLEE